jgi:hypothetical protein
VANDGAGGLKAQPNAGTTLAGIPDGTSNILLVGKKTLNPNQYAAPGGSQTSPSSSSTRGQPQRRLSFQGQPQQRHQPELGQPLRSLPDLPLRRQRAYGGLRH